MRRPNWKVLCGTKVSSAELRASCAVENTRSVGKLGKATLREAVGILPGITARMFTGA